MSAWPVMLALAVAIGAISSAVSAQEQQLSPLERESVRRALEQKKADLEPEPEGKFVEAVEVVTLEVIEDRDPLPRFLNVFHAKTRPFVIQREVLLRPGDVYSQKLVRESERNLRVRQLSVVVIVPVKGRNPGTVRLLVVTKDVWSLRLNSEPQIVNGKLTYLSLQPSEENLLGAHKTANAQVQLTRTTYSVGLGLIDPRVAGTRMQALVDANVVFNCRTHDAEGSYGNLVYGKPLYSLTQTRWAWTAAVQWSDLLVRPARSRAQSVCSGESAALLDFAATPAIDRVPYEYRRDVLRSQFSATRSFGAEWKNNISFGLEADRRAHSVPELAQHASVVQDNFSAILPTSDTRLSPFVLLESFRNRFHRVVNAEDLALQEDYRLGHDVRLRVYPASRDVGSTRNLLGLYNGVGYTIAVADGLWRTYVESTIELSALDKTDAEVRTGTRFISPKLGIGRFVYDGYVLHRYVNYLNPISALGGTGRLRGYQQSAVLGPNVVVSNIEFRTLPVELLSVQFAAALFWDTGDAFRTFKETAAPSDEIELRHGFGAGIRFLAPQVDRYVFRLDFGFPLDRSKPGAETTIVGQFQQAFEMPSLSPPGLRPSSIPPRLAR